MDSRNGQNGAGNRESQSFFADLLTDLLTHFINIPADQVDCAIEDAQRRICDFHGLDRSTLWQTSEGEPDVLLMTHVHQPSDNQVVTQQTDNGVAPYGVWIKQTSNVQEYYLRFDGKAIFPWTVEKLKSGTAVCFSSLDELPEEAVYDREMYREFGSKSSLVLPLFVGGTWLGALTFASLYEEREWGGELVKHLNLMARIFANALDRKRNDRNLCANEARLTLAAESADASLWKLFLNSGHIWVTENSWSLYGRTRDEHLTLQRFLEFVHVDDRDRLSCAVQEATGPGGRLLVEYRLLSADGTVHWVVSRGRLQTSETGEPYCLTGATVDITERKLMEEQLQSQFRKIEELKRRVESENLYLQEEIKVLAGHGAIISHSAAMRNVISQARQVAGTDSTVLILGETGTGKELLARAIHDLSVRNGRPLITVNCASLPPTLIEAELFGREKGAYTGALTRMVGLFELADGSTIFLDEIGELPIELQAKLLRVIEDRTVQRLGSPTPIKVNLRIIAATNRNLFEEVKSGGFRSDLYYRLNVFPIQIPPLRDRPEDIPPLVWSLLREFQETMGQKIERITEKTMTALTSYHWPGNVRELRNIIERAMILCTGTTLEVRIPETVTVPNVSHVQTLRDVEREQILAALVGANWKVGGKGGAAELLGLERTTLNSKMKKLDIKHPPA
jgi:PAS domain S-box-containing protein